MWCKILARFGQRARAEGKKGLLCWAWSVLVSLWSLAAGRCCFRHAQSFSISHYSFIVHLSTPACNSSGGSQITWADKKHFVPNVESHCPSNALQTAFNRPETHVRSMAHFTFPCVVLSSLWKVEGSYHLSESPSKYRRFYDTARHNINPVWFSEMIR